MAYVLADRVLETSTTQGTGTINLAGATTGYQSFVDGIGDGNTCAYTIKDGTNWETGIGTVTAGSPDTLSRDTILASSNSDAAVDWGTGTRDVYVAPLAGDVLSKRRDETVTGDNTFTGDNIFQGVVDVTNVNAEGSGGGALRTNGGTDCLLWGSGGSANLTAGGNLSMDTTHKIVNCADPTSAQDVATKNYVDSNTFEVGSGTAVATTSGTAFDFTSIPAGTKQIAINFEDVSTNGSDNLLIQIGDSGGVETSGYVSGCSDVGGNVSSTTGFIIKCNSAGNSISGTVILNLLDSATYTWVANGTLNVSSLSPRLLSVAGDKSLSATLDRVRLTRTGSDTFDNGKVNINYI